MVGDPNKPGSEGDADVAFGDGPVADATDPSKPGLDGDPDLPEDAEIVAPGGAPAPPQPVPGPNKPGSEGDPGLPEDDPGLPEDGPEPEPEPEPEYAAFTTHAQLDGYLSELGIEPPEGWSGMTVAAKKSWLDEEA